MFCSMKKIKGRGYYEPTVTSSLGRYMWAYGNVLNLAFSDHFCMASLLLRDWNLHVVSVF